MKRLFRLPIAILLLIALTFSLSSCEQLMVTLFGPQLVSISVEKQPDKLAYEIGEELDLTGGELRLDFSGDEPDQIIEMTMDGVTTAGFQKTAIGTQDVTIKYKGKSTEIEVSVTDNGTPNPDPDPDTDPDTDPDSNAVQSDLVKPHFIDPSEREVNPIRAIDSVENEVDLSQYPVETPVQVAVALTQLLNAVTEGKRPILSSDPQNPVTKVYNAAIEMLDNFILNDFSDYERVHTIYDWIIYYNEYDHALLDSYLENPSQVDPYDPAFSLLGVFANGLAVCDGFSKAFSLLCGIEGIETERVVGWYPSEDGDKTIYIGHAWNKVNIEVPDTVGKAWYFVDTTFGNLSLFDTETEKYTEYLSHAYFLLSDEETKTHYQDDLWYLEGGEIYKKSTPSAGAGGLIYSEAVTEFDYFASSGQAVADIEEFEAYIVAGVQNFVEAVEVKFEFDILHDDLISAFSKIFYAEPALENAWYIEIENGIYIFFLEYNEQGSLLAPSFFNPKEPRLAGEVGRSPFLLKRKVDFYVKLIAEGNKFLLNGVCQGDS